MSGFTECLFQGRLQAFPLRKEVKIEEQVRVNGKKIIKLRLSNHQWLGMPLLQLKDRSDCPPSTFRQKHYVKITSHPRYNVKTDLTQFQSSDGLFLLLSISTCGSNQCLKILKGVGG